MNRRARHINGAKSRRSNKLASCSPRRLPPPSATVPFISPECRRQILFKADLSPPGSEIELVLFVLVLSTLLLIDAKPEGHAHSFQHFHGPVTGNEHEVTWDDDDGYHEDYVAHPHYAFSYGVEDHHTGDYHGQKEHRDGTDVFGEYTVKEPDGNIRTVRYRAGKDGFHAKVHNSHRKDRQQDDDDDHYYDHY